MIARLGCLLLSLALAPPAFAVLIDSGDGTGNTSAPSPDPGWDHVGICNGLTGVYLGDGWVLTANHVGACDPSFIGVTYPSIPGTAVRLHNQDSTLADLLLFRVAQPYPPLAALVIADATPPDGTPLVMIGRGRNRGAPTTWDPPGPGPTIDGYLWGPGVAMRWGTNFVETVPELPSFEDAFVTRLFSTVFDASGPGHSLDEAQAASGDSGGAVFASTGGSGYELAGILIGIAMYQGQPAETALYGNDTVAADLSQYRDEIVALPEPAGGLAPASALVCALAVSRRRRTNAS
jgi:trypsin-like peptidase